MSKRKEQYKRLHKEAFSLFLKKNEDYGDAFANYGSIGVIVRLGDKINRSKKIREMYSNMSKEIGDRMSEFYVELTNMYLEQENILREISSEISSNSVKKLLIDDNELKKVERFNSYKIYVNLIKVVDMLVRLGVGYKIDGNKMLSDKFEMKIGKEKLSINLFDIDVLIKLDVKKDNKNNLELLEKLLK